MKRSLRMVTSAKTGVALVTTGRTKPLTKAANFNSSAIPFGNRFKGAMFFGNPSWKDVSRVPVDSLVKEERNVSGLRVWLRSSHRDGAAGDAHLTSARLCVEAPGLPAHLLRHYLSLYQGGPDEGHPQDDFFTKAFFSYHMETPSLSRLIRLIPRNPSKAPDGTTMYRRLERRTALFLGVRTQGHRQLRPRGLHRLHLPSSFLS